jgi:PmbA protein
MNLKKEMKQIEDTSAKLLNLALQAGAENAEVCASYGISSKINLEKQDFHLASSDEGYHFGLRVIKDDQQGFVSCNTQEQADLKELALRAVEIAGFSPKNPYNKILPSENVGTQSPKAELDEKILNLSFQTLKEYAEILNNTAQEDKRFKINEGSVSSDVSISLVMNSKGTYKIEQDALVSWGMMGMAIENDKMTSFDYFQNMSRDYQKTAGSISKSIKEFTKNVVQNLSQGPAKSYKGLVFFSPRAVNEVLLSGLLSQLNGRAILEKVSLFSMDDLGKEIIHPSLTLLDNPWLRDRFSFSSFDREGTPTKPLTLIEKGILKSFILDNYSATGLKMKSTGHAIGGASSIPNVGNYSIQISKGNETLLALLERATKLHQEFLWVDRYSGQVDPVTGDFSGVAKGASWFSNGERAYCVSETMIAGNLFSGLRSDVFGDSEETQVIDNQEESPTIVLDGISVVSK